MGGASVWLPMETRGCGWGGEKIARPLGPGGGLRDWDGSAA